MKTLQGKLATKLKITFLSSHYNFIFNSKLSTNQRLRKGNYLCTILCKYIHGPFRAKIHYVNLRLSSYSKLKIIGGALIQKTIFLTRKSRFLSLKITKFTSLIKHLLFIFFILMKQLTGFIGFFK